MNLVINKPKIYKNKVSSKIEYDNKEYELFFSVDDEYANYLCDESANAFLIALIPFIVKNNYNVEVRAPISSQLYYQITNYLLPLLCQEFNKKEIKIVCQLTDEKFESNGVGASISCGVDSFYTLFKHKNTLDQKYEITHVCFFNAGSNGEYGGEKARKLYNERILHIKEFCKEQNYKLVTVDSNMNELIKMNHEKRHTFTTLSCVYVLEKLFNKYYFASGLGFNGSHISEEDTAFYDILNVHCLSNENIQFYCSGIETTRMKNVEFISQYSETYNWLNVCIKDQWENCCKCHKCIRTMTALDSIGKLENYRQVFDINYYKINRTKILSKIIRQSRDKTQREFAKEIIDSYRKNNRKIPILAYVFSLKLDKNNLKALLPKSLVRKIKRYLKKENKNDGWTD